MGVGGDLKLAALAFDRFRGLPVAGVAGVLARGVMPFVAEVVSQLALQRPLDHGFRELLILLANPQVMTGANLAK